MLTVENNNIPDTGENATPQEERTFTQADVNKIVSERLAKEKSRAEATLAVLQSKISELEKAREIEIEESKAAYEAEIAKIKRHTETKEFFSNLPKFCNPETAAHYENALNAALEDKANEGKNRKDIFDALIKGEDGSPRTDIFAKDPNPNPLYIPPVGNIELSENFSLRNAFGLINRKKG